MIKYLSTFSGIAGFELGIGNLAKCIGYSEIDKYAIQIYNKHFNHKNYGNITTIDPTKLPDFDLIVGGFPCQSFSIAGKRGGFKDTRGTLFFNIAEIIKIKRPRLLFLENVKGLLSHNEGNTFATIISTLDELGYDCQWQVLNSKNFGVPQNRERVFIIGHLRGTPRPKVFPIGEESKEDTRRAGREISYTIDANYAKGTNTTKKSRRQIVKVINPLKGKTKYGWHFEQNVFDKKGISRAVKASSGSGNKLKIIQPVLTPDRLKKRQNGRRIKDNGEPSFTLTGQDKHGIYDGAKIRRLTPIECERLQGFPDDWTEGLSDTQRYKTLGNAVTTNVIKAIAERLL